MPSLLAVLGLDASSFHAKLGEAQKLAGKAGQNMGASLTAPIKQALGAFAVGMVLRDAFGMANQIKDLSTQFRVSSETIQKWDIAAKQAGMSASDVGNGLNKLKKAREEAVGSNKSGGFAEFAIPMEALRDASISTEQILERMMEVAGGGNITDAQDVAGLELMGRSGAKLLSVFQELHDMGPVSLLSDDEIDKMDAAIDGFENLKRKAASTAGQGYIAATAAPASLWSAVKDLWNYASGGRKSGEAFRFDIGSSYGGGGVDTNAAAKLRGPMVEGMSKDQVSEMRRVQLDLAEKIFQNSLKTMTVEEKRASLNKQIADHAAAADKAFEDAEWLKGYQEQLKAEGLRTELLGIKDDPMKRSKSDVNALQRIGAYAPDQNGQRQSMLNIERHVREIAQRGAHARPAVVGGF